MNQTGVASTGSRRQARDEAIVHAAAAAAKAVRAAAIVASISAGPWAIDGNQASNCEGGSSTPWSSIEPKNRAYAARSEASASAASTGTDDRKNTVSSGPTLAIAVSQPASAAASASPSARSAAVSSRRS